MSKKINLEEILDFHIGFASSIPPAKHFYINAMIDACRKTLELAAENAKIDVTEEYENGEVRYRYSHKCKSSLRCSEDDYYYQINKQSILDTINQIE